MQTLMSCLLTSPPTAQPIRRLRHFLHSNGWSGPSHTTPSCFAHESNISSCSSATLQAKNCRWCTYLSFPGFTCGLYYREEMSHYESSHQLHFKLMNKLRWISVPISYSLRWCDALYPIWVPCEFYTSMSYPQQESQCLWSQSILWLTDRRGSPLRIFNDEFIFWYASDQYRNNIC